MASARGRRDSGARSKRPARRKDANWRPRGYRKLVALEPLESRMLLSGYYTSRQQFLDDAQLGPTTSIDFESGQRGLGHFRRWFGGNG